MSFEINDLLKKINISKDGDNFFIESAILEIKKMAINSAKNDYKNNKIILISDENIWMNYKSHFQDILQQNHIDYFLLKNPIADEFFLNQLLTKIESCDFIIAFGGGTISDLCKIAANKLNIDFATFVSAASMNGYLSKNASIKINGHKKSISAKLPLKVFCDLNIIKNAPKKLIKAGIGDLMCFYSCKFDWYLSHKLLDYDFDGRPFALLQDKMDFFVKNYQKYQLDDLDFHKVIIEILLLSGIGMTICGSSNPASQSEHLIAHAIEMKHPKVAKDLLHGQIIAVTTITAVNFQQEILNNFEEFYKKLQNFTAKNYKKEVMEFFGRKVGEECLFEYDIKLKKIKSAQLLDKKDLLEIKEYLNQIFFDSSKIKKIFNHFKISSNHDSLNLSQDQYSSSINNSRYIRNRFTCLDL